MFNMKKVHGGIKFLYNLSNHKIEFGIFGAQNLSKVEKNTGHSDSEQSTHTFSAELSIGYDLLDNNYLKLSSNIYLRETYLLIPKEDIYKICPEGNARNKLKVSKVKIKANGSNYVSISPELSLLFRVNEKLAIGSYLKYNISLTSVKMNVDSESEIGLRDQLTNAEKLLTRLNRKLDMNSLEFGANFNILTAKNIKFSVDYRGIAFFGKGNNSFDNNVGIGVNFKL
jgi:hypothetical protein